MKITRRPIQSARQWSWIITVYGCGLSSEMLLIFNESKFCIQNILRYQEISDKLQNLVIFCGSEGNFRVELIKWVITGDQKCSGQAQKFLGPVGHDRTNLALLPSDNEADAKSKLKLRMFDYHAYTSSLLRPFISDRHKHYRVLVNQTIDQGHVVRWSKFKTLEVVRVKFFNFTPQRFDIINSISNVIYHFRLHWTGIPNS